MNCLSVFIIEFVVEQSVATKHYIIESLHASFQVKLELASVFFAHGIRGFQSAQLVGPSRNCIEAFVVGGQVRVRL